MDIVVFPDGRLIWDGRTVPCALGRSGVSVCKQEGDGATPVGCFLLRSVLYRPDRTPAPKGLLPIVPIRPQDGWVDDPNDSAYNRLVSLPYPARHERLWREDSVYDVIVILGYNDDPVTPGRGSAIFMHVAREQYQATEGCIALALVDLLDLLGHCSPASRLCVRSFAG